MPRVPKRGVRSSPLQVSFRRALPLPPLRHVSRLEAEGARQDRQDGGRFPEPARENGQAASCITGKFAGIQFWDRRTWVAVGPCLAAAAQLRGAPSSRSRRLRRRRRAASPRKKASLRLGGLFRGDRSRPGARPRGGDSRDRRQVGLDDFADVAPLGLAVVEPGNLARTTSSAVEIKHVTASPSMATAQR